MFWKFALLNFLVIQWGDKPKTAMLLGVAIFGNEQTSLLKSETQFYNLSLRSMKFQTKILFKLKCKVNEVRLHANLRRGMQLKIPSFYSNKKFIANGFFRDVRVPAKVLVGKFTQFRVLQSKISLPILASTDIIWDGKPKMATP